METSFDPYRKWLGIPRTDQPPHHYRLLGIEAFESDTDVISNAVDARMAQVKSYQAGKHTSVSQRILNELAAAKLCLLNLQKKATYDRQLRQRLDRKASASAEASAAGETSAPPAPPEPAAGMAFLDYAVPSTRTGKESRKVAKKKPLWPIYAVVGGVVGAVGLVVATSIFTQPDNSGKTNGETSKPAETANASDPHAKQNAKPDVKPEPKPKALIAEDPKPAPKFEPNVKPKADSQVASASVHKPNVESTSEPKPSKPESEAAGTDDSLHKPAHPKRTPVPSKANQQEAETKIRDIFKQEYLAAKSTEGKSALVAKLLEQADASKDDPTARYVLLRLGGTAALGAGEIDKALGVVDKLNEHYDMDGPHMKAEILAAAARSTSTANDSVGAVYDASTKMIDSAMAADDFDLASQLAKAALSAAHRSRDPQQIHDATAREREIDRLQARYSIVRKSLDVLENAPTDAKANLVAGQWYCFGKGDWKKGLPMLVKGDREDLADLAKRDLAKPAAAKERIALADAWWTLGEKETVSTKAGFENRARYWYEQGLPELTGLDKTRVEKRLEPEAATPAEATSSAANSRGALKIGNVALASNGATVTGPGTGALAVANLIDGNTTKYDGSSGHAAGKWPFEWIVTLNNVYRLQQIRLKLWDLDARLYRYAIAVSVDGRSFTVIADRSRGETGGWKDFRFPSRPVKAIKLIAISASANEFFGAVELEAYCQPLKGSK